MKNYKYQIQFLAGHTATVFTVGLTNAVILGMAEAINAGNDKRIESITMEDKTVYGIKEIKSHMKGYFSIN